MLMHEAVASVAMSHDEEVGTHALVDEVGDEEPGVTVVTGLPGGPYVATGEVATGEAEPEEPEPEETYSRVDLARAWQRGYVQAVTDHKMRGDDDAYCDWPTSPNPYGG